MKRRTFLRNSTASLAGVSLLGSSFIFPSAGPSKKIGIMLYTMARPLSDDFEGTLKELAGYGYKNVQFTGPYSFSPEEEIRNNPLISMMGLSGYGYYGNSPREVRKILDDLGLTSNSAHISDTTMNHAIDHAIEAAKEIGQEYLFSPMFMGHTAEDYKKTAEQYNKFGEKCKEAGIRYGYHTHSHEFAKYEGKTAFQILVENTEPDLVCFELDLFWAAVAGVDPVQLFEKYPGRIKILHVKEMKEKMDQVYASNEPFLNMEIGMKIFRNQTTIGEGIIDFKTIFQHASDAGIEHLIIESDFPDQPLEFARKSYTNLKGLL